MTSPHSGQASRAGPILHMVPVPWGTSLGPAQGCGVTMSVPVCLASLLCRILHPSTACLFKLISIGICKDHGNIFYLT